MWDNLFVIEINIAMGFVYLYSLEDDRCFEF